MSGSFAAKFFNSGFKILIIAPLFLDEIGFIEAHTVRNGSLPDSK